MGGMIAWGIRAKAVAGVILNENGLLEFKIEANMILR